MWLQMTCFIIKTIIYHYSREDSTEKRVQRAKLNDEIDQKFGYDRYKDPQERVGWLINMHPVRTNSKVILCMQMAPRSTF